MNPLKLARFMIGSTIVGLMLSICWAACAALADTGPSPLPTDSAQVLSLWEFTKAHWTDISAAVFGILLFFSEYMGQNPKIKSNGLYDLARNFLKAKAGKA